MMKTMLRNWNLMRAFRLVIGVFALVQAIMQQEVVVGLLGGLLLLTALANIGCCGSNGCAVDYSNKKEANAKKIDYEELDFKK